MKKSTAAALIISAFLIGDLSAIVRTNAKYKALLKKKNLAIKRTKRNNELLRISDSNHRAAVKRLLSGDDPWKVVEDLNEAHRFFTVVKTSY